MTINKKIVDKENVNLFNRFKVPTRCSLKNTQGHYGNTNKNSYMFAYNKLASLFCHEHPFLASIPSNRSDIVNELEIPEVKLSPYIFDPEPSISSSSLDTGTSTEECEFRSLSTDSSMPLSRAMTDSEIDYDRYKQYKRLNLTDPWDAMRIAMAAFPPEHLTSLSSLLSDSTDSQDSVYWPLPRDEELLLRLERGFQDFSVFEPEDPALLELEEALQSLDLEKLYAELDAIPLQY